jgi:predicted nucleotidyltransferase
MQVKPPPLLPILRSRLQAEVLTTVLLNPTQEWSLTDLAARARTSLSTAQREVDRAEGAGVVRSRRVGNTRLVSARAESPLMEPLTDLLLRAFGPPQVVAEELASCARVEQAFVFGSWAARYEGEQGPEPGDIDVLVIGAPDRDEVGDAADRAGLRLGRVVNVTIRSSEWWEEGDDALRREIVARPLVRLPFGSGPATDADDGVA